jgi:tetratricopeptide (TPR) repeat protein
MCLWQQGEKEQATKWNKAASLWMAKFSPDNDELKRFRKEAASLLGVPDQDALKDVSDGDVAVAVLDADPQTKAFWTWRALAEREIRAGRWSEAKAPALRYAALQPKDVMFQYHLACLLARVGDEDTYRRHCQSLLAHFAETAQSEWAERAAKSSLLLPATGEQLAAASRLAERAMTLHPNHWVIPFAHVAAALAAYRRGEFRASVEWCDKALARESEKVWFRNAQAHFIRALSESRLGNSAEAHAAYDKAAAILTSVQAAARPNSVGEPWHDFAICEVLQQEARQVLFNAAFGEAAAVNTIESTAPVVAPRSF